jgi:hypothetical protein
MKNPFRFGQLVKGEDFCNRLNELKEIKKAITNHYSFWIYSPRRYGKTSLILKAFEELPNIKKVYLDLYNIQSLSAFAEKYSRAVLKELFDWKSGIKNIGKKMSGFFKRITPKISFDTLGNPSISLESQAIKEEADIENILDIPEKIASQQKCHVCIAFDEFQEVNRIEPFLINWMRSAFQRHQYTYYVFLGSKQSLMETIFADPNSPFYEFGFKIPIKEISRENWETFIRGKFKKTGIEITDSTIKSIIEKSRGHPHFTQYFASMVWDFLAQGYDQEEPGFTAAWMARLIAGQSIVFQNQFDLLNQNQRKTLMAIASLKPGEQLFSEQCRKRCKLPVSPTLTTTLNSLLKKDLINKENGNYTILNPVLKEWLIQL